MRQGQQRRMRGRGRKGPNPLTRSYESNGPDVKIRGTALQIAEKYSQLARDAQASGDRIQGESLLQHAEHYYRILAAAQAQAPQPSQPSDRLSNGEEGELRGNGHNEDRPPARLTQEDPPFGLSDPQPYINGNGQDNTESETPEPAAEQAAEGTEDQTSTRSRSRRRRPYRPRSAEAQKAGDADLPAGAGDVQATAEPPVGDD